jgi:WD40 repeat protein
MNGVVRVWQVLDDDNGRLRLTRPRLRDIRTGRGLDFTRYGNATLAFSPDEAYIATTSVNNTVHIWDVDSKREVSRIAHNGSIESIAFGPGGQFATAGGGVKFWKTEFGSEAQRLACDNTHPGAGVNAMILSPGGEWLVTASDAGACVFRTTDWSPVARLQGIRGVSNLTFSADGRWLVAVEETTVTVIDTHTWQPRKEIVPFDDRHLDVSVVGFSPGGQWLVTVSGSLVKLFETETWQEVHTLHHDNIVKRVAFSPDGRWLATLIRGGYLTPHQLKPDEVHIWRTSDLTPAACRADVDPGAQRADDSQRPTLWGHAICAEVKGTNFEISLSEVHRWRALGELDQTPESSPDGHWFVCSENGTTLKYREGTTFRDVVRLTPEAWPASWIFTPDSRWLVVSARGTIALWPLERTTMIEAARARLRHGGLTPKEHESHDSDGQLEQACSSSDH